MDLIRGYQMFIKTGDAQLITGVYKPADVSDEATKKQLDKTIEDVKNAEKTKDAKETK